MEKTKVLCLILAMVLASAGTAGIVMGLGGETVAPPLPDNAVNTVMDKPDEGTPIDRSAIENLYIAQGELQRKGGFVGTTRGSTTSAGIRQEVINNRVVVQGNVFKEMITVGIVKNAYQLFMYNGNYLYRKFDSIKSASNIKWANAASKYGEKDFLEKFGHRSDSLTGYILNDETIVSGTLEKEENGLFQYRYVLDIDTAPARMLREMKTNSNMSDYSTYVKAEIVVVMDADWQVKTVTTDCKYKVPMFGGVDCIEDITETFSDLESNELPEMSFFEQFFDADLENPVDKDPDALSILMDMFAPYIGNGNSLNASIVATDNGQPVLSALVSTKIDIDNLENIEVAAKVGSDLFVEYQQGNVYVTYQDFKASTTVDGIMGVVNAFMPQTGSSALSDDEDNDILSKFTYSIADGVCTVSLPLELGEEKIEINIYANVTDGGYQFTNANVTFGELEINVELTNKFDVPAREGDYPEILGLLDLVKNGVICGSVNAFGMDVDVTFDLATMSMFATSADLSVLYSNETVYAQFGAIKAKLNVNDIDRIMTLLRVAGIVDGTSKLELPQISVGQIVAMLGGIEATATDNGVKFSLSFDDLSASLYLIATDGGWHVDKVTAAFGENVVTLSLNGTVSTEIPAVVDSEYANVMDLISEFLNPIASLAVASSYGADFDFDLTVNNKLYNVAGSFACDVNKNVKVNANVTNGGATLVKANVSVVDKVAYLDVNGLKTAFALGEMKTDVDLSQVVSEVYGANDNVDDIIDVIYDIINRVKSLDLSSVDFAKVIKQFSYEKGMLAITVNADFLGLSDIGVTLSVDDYSNLVVGVDGVALGNVNLDAQAAIAANVGKVSVPNSDDYILSLKGSVNSDIEFVLTADLLNMDIYASVNMFDNTILARYVDGKVYLNVGEVYVMGTVSELGALVDYVMTSIGVDVAAIDTGSFANADLSVEAILKAISINVDGALSLGLKFDDLADVSVNFDDKANFVDVTAVVSDYNIKFVNSNVQAQKLDVNKVYVPVEALTRQIVEIYDNFKNILTTGVSAKLATSVRINGSIYALSATVNYNNGVYLNAQLSDGASKIVALDMFIVDNVLYMDVNGVRVATELPESQDTNSADISVETVIGMLSKAKGYNDVLDSVIAVVEQLPAKFNDVNYLDLLSALTYDDGVLSVGINGKALGLSDFELTVAGTQQVNVTLNNLAIGNVTIDSLTVNVIPACDEVTAPTSEYVTELEIDVMGYKVFAKLDLLDRSVAAKTTLLGHELGLYYANNTVYVSYGAINAKLNVADADKLLAIISTFVDGGIPSVNMSELNVKEILNNLSKVTTANGFDFNASIAGVNVTLSFDTNAKLTDAKVNVSGVEATATVINGATYPSFDLTKDYVDLVAVVETYVEDVRNLMNADGYNVALNGNFIFDNNVYDVAANVIYHDGLYVNANVSYNSAHMINVELWLVDDTLYLSAGDWKLALAMPQSASTKTGGSNKIDLAPYMGYNSYVDNILTVVQSAIDKFASNNVDYVALISGLTFNNGELTLKLNGEQLGVALQSVTLVANNGFTANVSNLAVDRMTASFNASVKASDESVKAPKGDFTTNLTIRIDSENIIYANLDLIHGVYNFRLDDLYLMYSDNVVKVYKHNVDGNDIYVKGDFNQIIKFVKDIDDLVNEFSGASESTVAKIDFNMFSNVDVKAIVNSLAISASKGSATVSASAFGLDISVIFAGGTLNSVVVPVSLINKTLIIESCKPQTFDKFDNANVEYIAIEDVFNDYFPAIEKLVHTNSWEFHFDENTIITIGEAKYMLAKGSYFEFYYKNTEGLNTLKLRAKLDIRKYKGIVGTEEQWQPFMLIDVVYKDGNIYITDTGREVSGKRSTIRLTVSIDSILKCADLYQPLLEVVPQIGELVAKIGKAMSDANANAQNISYSEVLTNVSYVDGVFGLILNGKPLLDSLGSITLSARTYVNGTVTEGLYLNSLTFKYSSVEVELNGLRVVASDVDASYSDENKNDAKWQGGYQYLAVQDIVDNYDYESYHMDFNSIYELLSSFIKTAKPVEGSDGARSFYISGTAAVSLALGKLEFADLPIALSVKVDITPQNVVYISAKITRNNDKVMGIKAYDDDGGDSYLYFDGENGTFTVIRNSWTDSYEDMVYEVVRKYCSECGGNVLSSGSCVSHPIKHGKKYYAEEWGWVKKTFKYEDGYGYHERNFAKENISTADFTASIIDYLFEMINLNSEPQILLLGNSIEGIVLDNINNSSTNDFGIEDIFTNYSYSEVAADNAINTNDKLINSGAKPKITGDYKVEINLQPIDKNLTSATLDIYHDENYQLYKLTGNLSVLNGLCTIRLDTCLGDSQYGDAKNVVKNLVFWHD